MHFWRAKCETDLEIIPTQCKFVIHVVWIYINKLYSVLGCVFIFECNNKYKFAWTIIDCQLWQQQPSTTLSKHTFYFIYEYRIYFRTYSASFFNLHQMWINQPFSFSFQYSINICFFNSLFNSSFGLTRVLFWFVCYCRRQREREKTLRALKKKQQFVVWAAYTFDKLLYIAYILKTLSVRKHTRAIFFNNMNRVWH